MKEILNRLKAETPKFFKKLRNIGLSLSALGYGLPNIPNFPADYAHLSGQFIWIGLTVALVAQTAVQKPEELAK